MPASTPTSVEAHGRTASDSQILDPREVELVRLLASLILSIGKERPHA